MKSTILQVTTYLCTICMVSGIFTTDAPRNTSAEKRTSHISEKELTQNERNRRLIPYTTYYVAGGSPEQSNRLQITGDEQAEDEKTDYINSPRLKQRPSTNNYNAHKTQYDYNGQYQQQPDLVSGYNYIPIAYIPGARGIHYSPESQYYSNSYYNTYEVPDDHRIHTTVKPKQYTTTTTTAADAGKNSLPYFSEYFAQQPNTGQAADSFFKYLPTSIRNQNPALDLVRKPTHSPLLLTTPQTNYLNFRYSDLYKTHTPKYDVTSTPPTVEITSPKHYIVPNGASTAAASNQLNHITTPSYSLAYDYPEAAQFAYSVPLTHSQLLSSKPTAVKNKDQATQSNKVLMSALKNQEISYFSNNPSYQVPFVPKPFISDGSTLDVTVDDILKEYQINKQLPERITPDNIKESIKTLSYILQILQKADSITHLHSQPSLYSKDLFQSLKESQTSSAAEEQKSVNALHVDSSYDSYNVKESSLQDKPLNEDQNTPGRAGIDYPTLSTVPETSFTCKSQRYKGFFADPDTKCQVWHYCDLNGGQASFLCPNGTIFNQAALTCDWWFNVKCSATSQLYVLNERLYKYIIPLRPSFPEDYSGPLVDQYLTEKFKETESQRKYRYPTMNNTSGKTEPGSTFNLTAFSEYDIPAHLLNENL